MRNRPSTMIVISCSIKPLNSHGDRFATKAFQMTTTGENPGTCMSLINSSVYSLLPCSLMPDNGGHKLYVEVFPL